MFIVYLFWNQYYDRKQLQNQCFNLRCSRHRCLAETYGKCVQQHAALQIHNSRILIILPILQTQRYKNRHQQEAQTGIQPYCYKTVL